MHPAVRRINLEVIIEATPKQGLVEEFMWEFALAPFFCRPPEIDHDAFELAERFLFWDARIGHPIQASVQQGLFLLR